ncbi:MAG: small, acid-soluble spore protein, alpha/beta type [Halanaerobium sp.]|nr:small, acid-soluble spore protein, alpha/beta type [Halanaerobium sp.]
MTGRDRSYEHLLTDDQDLTNFRKRWKELPKSKNKRIPKTRSEYFLEKVKWEVADELGLKERILEQGWTSLTAQEAGRMGGCVTQKIRRLRKKKSP